ncbi:MAG: hypothetical protein MUE41_18000 [Gemmatimonadaceae bacterium]|jgi:hypothetical protein|nr:hypothetical protein [Gemmatimonadaceae bacterium]
MRSLVPTALAHHLHRGAWAFLLAPVLGGCLTYTVAPDIVPERLPKLEPVVQARAILLLTPAFSSVVGQHQEWDADIPMRHTWRYQVGSAADSAIRLWASNSFAKVEVRRLSEDEALLHFMTGRDADSTDVLLLPRLEGQVGGSPYAGMRFPVSMRVDTRVMRTGSTFSVPASATTRNSWFRSSEHDSGKALTAAIAALNAGFMARRGGL